VELVVDLSTGDVSLQNAHEMNHFCVQGLRREQAERGTDSAQRALEVALRAKDIGTVESDGEVLVRPDVVRRLAVENATGRDDSIGAEWESGFAAMLDYAATKGWIADDGSIRLHVEWGIAS
jgi:hypothetical protein